MLLVTTTSIPGKRYQVIDTVSTFAQCDFTNSSTMKNDLAKCIQEARDLLIQKATELKASAVVAIHSNFSELKNTILYYIEGTAVVYVETSNSKKNNVVGGSMKKKKQMKGSGQNDKKKNKRKNNRKNNEKKVEKLSLKEIIEKKIHEKEQKIKKNKNNNKNNNKKKSFKMIQISTTSAISPIQHNSRI
jgi:hypothetical protein